MINVSKTENIKSFLRHSLWCTVLSEEEIYCAMFPGFGRLFQFLQTIMLKGLLGGIPRIKNIKDH